MYRQEKEEKKIEKVRERERLADQVEMMQSELREIKQILVTLSRTKDPILNLETKSKFEQ